MIISMVTFNRRAVLERTLNAILTTTEWEEPRILITDNGSTDGTAEFLREMEDKHSRIKVWSLRENLGTASGRNAHWQECLGVDTVRMDDKVLPLAEGWLTALQTTAYKAHGLVATPYDPTVMFLHRIAPPIEYFGWDTEQGQGGPLIFIPGEVTAALQGVDEYTDGEERCLYGWDDVSYIERARLLGWNFGWGLHIPVEYLTSANPARRSSAMRWHSIYVERRQQYQQAGRDIDIPIEQTYGYKAGQEARADVPIPSAE